MLRREGYSGPLTMVSADDTPPYDRPNVSKDFLMGTAPEEWMPLRDAQYYADRQIELMLNERVTSIDAARRVVRLANGRQIAFGALLLATGADPVRLAIPATAARGSFIYAPWPIVARSLRSPNRQKPRSSSGRVLSGSRLPRRSAHAALRCTWWGSSEYR